MAINKARKIRSSDREGFAWSGLRKFQNIDIVIQDLIRTHSVPTKWHRNVRKQAQQLRYCLIQAREYFQAAQAVSLATKPNLLYYGTMSLALAEILFKQSGDSSLDKARDEHRHHGLQMTVGGIGRDDNLANAADRFRALPIEINGARRGTFELWHQSAREDSAAGEVTRFSPSGGSTTGYDLMFHGQDQRLPSVPSEGLTLWQCLRSLPEMQDYLEGVGFESSTVRGSISSQVRLGDHWSNTLSIILHPSSLVDVVLEQMKVDANFVDRITCQEILGGAEIRIAQDWVSGTCGMNMPPAATHSVSELRYMYEIKCLNEFGLFYVALFILGNYARYFPDRWLSDIERTTELAMAVEVLCSIAQWRVPFLTLCELDGILYAFED